MMKTTDLERIISGINRKYLNELCGPLPDGNAGDGKVASRRSPASGKTICEDKGCFWGVSSSPCFCGITKGEYRNGAELEEVIILRDPASNPPEGKVAVVATIDDLTEREGKDLPVILAVGINYGQGAKYLTSPVSLWHATGMRTKLDKVFATLRTGTKTKCVTPKFSNPSEYHLVATNFFPWITQKSWSACKLNSIEEMLLINCHDFRDPYAHIEEICRGLKKELQGLVFHGANNAVPLMGAEFIRSRMPSADKTPRPDIIFCDNLAGSPHITNAVRIC